MLPPRQFRPSDQRIDFKNQTVKEFDDGLIGAYINADVAYLTDSDESESDMR